MNPFDDSPLQLQAKVCTTLLFLILANIIVWAWAWVALADSPTLLGTAFLAYIFGLRHAFDADHIAAIDNVVRKLMQHGKRPYSAGFFFSLGHSTVVVLASIVIAATTAAMQNKLHAFQEICALVGTVVSAFFLLAMGVANLFVLKGILKAFRRARRGVETVDKDLYISLGGLGFLARIFRPVFNIVSWSWMMYPVGLLFGLGFDTATEVGLLGISATQGAHGVSPWTILLFPALFTAGMSLMDTTDSVLMTSAYGWAYINPISKLWYNLTITISSVMVAVFIGGLEVLGLIKNQLDLRSGFWTIIGDLNGNLANFGYVVVGIFIGTWALSTILYSIHGKGPAETA